MTAEQVAFVRRVIAQEVVRRIAKMTPAEFHEAVDRHSRKTPHHG